ncbi:hypothetical protein Tco_1109572 [Tanacetum coccineum]
MVLLCSIQQGLDFTRIGECLDEGSTVAERWGLFHIEPCLFGEVVADTVFELLSDGFVRRKVNYVVMVVDLTDVYKAFFCGGDFKRVLAIKSLFHCPSIRTSKQGILPKKRDPADDYFALTEAFYRAVLQSDRTHSPRRRIRLVL